ncbi:MAG: site-specific integrase [bacterium]|nr:site-specific integrase [bacterium]
MAVYKSTAPRRRKKPWVHDVTEVLADGTKRRHQRFYATEDDACAADARWRKGVRHGPVAVSRAITFADYVTLLTQRHQGQPRTIESFATTCALHLLPTFARRRLVDITRADAKALLATKKAEPVWRRVHGKLVLDAEGQPIAQRAKRAGASVRIMYSVLRYVGSEAVEDGLLDHNPFAKLGRRLKLEIETKARQHAIKKRAMTAGQLRRFLAGAQQWTPRFYPLFLFLARTGLRIGEALALRVHDVAPDFRAVHVERELSDGRIKAPKTPSSVRDVQVTAQAAAVLRRSIETQRKADKLAHGWRRLPEWVFYAETEPPECTLLPDETFNPAGTLDPHNVRRVMRRVLRALHRQDAEAGVSPDARFPVHFSPHSCRHSFASLNVQAGKSLEWVQRQLGHEDFALTVNCYGSWLPAQTGDASDVLDDADWQDAEHG